MAELDRGGKILLQRRPAEIVRLTHPGVRRVRPLGGEAVTADAVADGVFLAREGKRDVLHQVELVAEPGSREGRRVVRRACTLYAAYLRPVRISVLYLHRSRDRRRSPASFRLPLGREPVPVRFRVVRVWEDLSAQEELARSRPVLGRLALVGLMKGTSLEAVAQAAALIGRKASSPEESADLQAALSLLSERRFTIRRLRAIIPREVLMKSSIWREAQREGRKEGRKEGREEGRKEGQQQALLRQCRKRFGRLSRETRQRVEAATVKQLDRWLVRVLDAESLEQVFDQA